MSNIRSSVSSRVSNTEYCQQSDNVLKAQQFEKIITKYRLDQGGNWRRKREKPMQHINNTNNEYACNSL